MSTDSPPPRPPGRAPRPPRWRFIGVELMRQQLPRPLIIPRGPVSHEVSEALEVRLHGELDPGDMRYYDSYMPEIRISGTSSSRMSDEDGEYRFTFYPEVDGDVRGPIEFRARLDDPFEPTGLSTGDETTAGS